MHTTYKILKHKTLPDTYGRIARDGKGFRLEQIPHYYLFRNSHATIEDMIAHWQRLDPIIAEQLSSYDLIIGKPTADDPR